MAKEYALYVKREGYFTLSLQQIILGILSLFLWFSVLNAPLRYIFGLFHVDALIYLPKILFLLIPPLLIVARQKIALNHAILALMLLISFVWGIINLPAPQQSVFEIWVILPFLFGLWAGRFIEILYWRRLFLVLFITASTGVLLNPLIHYPWIGQDITLFNHNIQISRYWTAFSVVRYAGFSRASFSAASQTLIFALILILALKNNVLRLSIWLITLITIAITTSKGLLGAWILLSIYFAGGFVFHWAKFWIHTWISLLSLIIFLMILLPLSTLFINYRPDFSSLAANILFASFGERLNWMWPSSLHLLNIGGIYHWLTGRGIGGIGAAQLYFNPQNYLSADNMFVYMAVTLGIPATLFLFVVLIRRLWTFFGNQDQELYLLPISLMIFTYAIVANMNGQPVMNLFMGIVISKLFRNQKSQPLDIYTANGYI